MTRWLNHVAHAGPRNGTDSHTVDPASATNVVAGAAFATTTGRLLVCFADGPVTSTTPTGWTLPSGGSAINNTGLYVWWREAAGGDTFSTTHNASNDAVMFDIYEFETGSLFVDSVAATGVSTSGGGGPTLSGLTGTHLDAGIYGKDNSNGPDTLTWDSGTEEIDYDAANGTDGYHYGLTYIEDSVASSADFAATDSDISTTAERLVVAVEASEMQPVLSFRPLVVVA